MSRQLKILQVHNYYAKRGGEDVVVDTERNSLRMRGHQVELYKKTNNRDENRLSQFREAGSIPWSFRSFRDIQSLTKVFRPDIAHVHNTFHKITPSAIWAINSLDIPVVMTIHNYRIMCANGMFLRHDEPCERCMNGIFGVAAITNRCYRQSRVKTLPIVTLQALHRMLGTYKKRVDLFIVMTSFLKSKMIEFGVPHHKIFVRPHYVPAAELPETPAQVTSSDKRHFVFVGRLAREKGVDLLLSAWRLAFGESKEVMLTVIGDGVEKHELESNATGLNIKFTGWLTRDQVLRTLGQADFLVMASRWYETFGLAIIEAFSTATAAVGPDHGGIPELVKDGDTGYLFEPNSVKSLAATLEKAVETSVEKLESMKASSLAFYRSEFSEKRTTDRLIEAYEQAINSHHKR